jgi:hypothetical protein
LTLLATSFGLFEAVLSPIESSDWRKSRKRVENERHTSAHQLLTSCSTIGATIPPLSAIAKIVSKYAAICALLLFLSMVTLFVFIALGIQI